MAKTLTAASIAKVLPDPAKRLEIGDGACPGLRLVVSPTGAKSFVVRYKLHGRAGKLTLGPVDRLTLAEARERTRIAMAMVTRGESPALAKKVAREAARQAQGEDADLWASVLNEFEKRHAPGIRSGGEMLKFLRRETSDWNRKRIQEIKRKDVVRLLDAVVDDGRPSTAIKIRAHLSKLYAWALARDIVETSPIIGLPKPATETSRDRVLSDRELRLVWLGAGRLQPPFRQFVRCLLLTGQRRSEVAGMRRDELHGVGGPNAEWRLPAARVKNAREHVVPLTPTAATVIECVPFISDGVERVGYVFTTNGRTAVSGFSKVKLLLDQHIADIASEEAADAGLECPTAAPWRFHDLRRTAATKMAELGAPPHIIEHVLNHVSGTRGGVAAVYNRAKHDREKRDALEAFERHILGLIGQNQS